MIMMMIITMVMMMKLGRIHACGVMTFSPRVLMESQPSAALIRSKLNKVKYTKQDTNTKTNAKTSTNTSKWKPNQAHQSQYLVNIIYSLLIL